MFCKSKLFYMVTLIFISPFLASQSMGETRVGISATGGLGVFVPAEKDYYMGSGADLYPEIALQMDVSMIRAGLRLGYIWRKKTEEYYSYYNYSSWEYTVSFLPAQAEICIFPLDLIKPDTIISPYVGLMAGAYIATGDNDKTLPAFSIKLGSEMRLEPFVAYGDIRYTLANDSRVDMNAGGFMIVCGLGLRYGTSRKAVR